jgi:preprotein translocase subunit SecY
MLGQILLIFNNQTLVNIANALQQFLNNQLAYGISYFVLVFAFTYFYTALTFEPNEIAKNLQKQGGFIAGIRPGDQTSHYLSNILNRITLFGALFLGIIAVLPLIVQALTGISAISLGGTSLLIVVSVGLETIKAIKSQLLMREYEI